MRENLNLFEAACLAWRAKRDVKREVFYEVPFSNGCPPSVISPFITMELNRFAAQRESIVSRRKYRYFLPSHNLVMKKRKGTLRKALDEIDASIASINARISSRNMLLERELNDLNQRRNGHRISKEFHLIQLCDNQEMDAWAKYYKETLCLYETIIALCSKELVLLTEAADRVNLLLSRRLLRIQSYYSVAAPNRSLQNQELVKYGKLDDFENAFQERRKLIIESRDSFQSKLSEAGKAD